MFASQNGDAEIVRSILEQGGVDLNIKYVILLLLKIISLIQYFKMIFRTALMMACQLGYTGIVKLLLGEKGININVKESH